MNFILKYMDVKKIKMHGNVIYFNYFLFMKYFMQIKKFKPFNFKFVMYNIIQFQLYVKVPSQIFI